MEVDAGKRFGRPVVLLLLLVVNLALLLSFFPSPSAAAGGRFELKHYESSYNKKAAVASFDDAEEAVHERVLKANTIDYGRYDPTPTASKPDSKIINY